MDWRVRLLGRVLRMLPSVSVSGMSEQQVLKVQRQSYVHNPAVDLISGGVVSGVREINRVVTTAAGDVPLRIYVPEGVVNPPLVLNFHGGGWVRGTLSQYDWLCGTVSATVGAVAVSVGYRLAPAHRFPAAVEDCYAALCWAVDNAHELGADGDRVAVLGDSAGGNLAAVSCLVSRERGGPSIAYQALAYPLTDATCSGSSVQVNANKPVLDARDLRAYVRLYLGDGDPRDPHVSPLLADDHAGLPPALIQVAEHDPLHDDGVRFADALRNAGVSVRLTEYVGMPHGYLSFPGLCRAVPQAMNELCAQLDLALSR